jgi:hypothetical protein
LETIAAIGEVIPTVSANGTAEAPAPRGVAEHELEDLGEQEQGPEQAEEDQRHRDRGGREAWVAEHLERHHRVLAAQLPGDERGEQRDGGGEDAERGGRRPAAFGRLNQAVGQRDEPGERQDRSDGVEPRGALRVRGGDERASGDQRDDHDRDVDEEHRAPAEVLQQPAAEGRADGDGEAADPGPDADRLDALARILEHVGEDRQRGRHDRGRADAHQRSGCDQLAGVRRQRRERGAEAEHREAAGEQPMATVAVAERAADQQQAGHGERVRIDNPLQLTGPGVQFPREGRQCGVDDRVVDDDEEHAQAQDDERPPAALVRLGGGLGGEHRVICF